MSVPASPIVAVLGTGSEVGPTTGPDLTGYLLVCAGLIGGIALLALGFRRLFGNALRERGAKRSLAVLDVLQLGGRRRVAVVRCYDRTFALGLGDKEVNVIAELDLEDAPAEVVRRFQSGAGSFRGELDAAEPVPPAPRQGRPGPAPRERERKAAPAEAGDGGADELILRMRREGVLG